MLLAPKTPNTLQCIGNCQLLQQLPEMGQCFHGPTLVTLSHCEAPRDEGRATSTLPSSFLLPPSSKGQKKGVMNQADC